MTKPLRGKKKQATKKKKQATRKKPASSKTRPTTAVVPPSEPTETPINLILIDDNRLLREGIVQVIMSQPGFRVLAASADVDEAIELVRSAKPDIVLLDFGLANHDSLALATLVRAEVPEARVIVMGLLSTEEDVAAFLHAGASGFIMKDASFETLFSTIRAVAGGAQVLPRELTTSLFSQITSHAAGRSKERILESVRLTSREREVVGLLGEGLSNKEISTRINIAVHTVKSHVHNILEKLSLRSRLEVAAFSHSRGPLPPPK